MGGHWKGGDSMKGKILCFSILMAFAVIAGTGTAMAAKETINIMCWEGYADKAFIDDFKRVVKEEIQN